MALPSLVKESRDSVLRVGAPPEWIATVIVRGEHIEGRGATGTDALVDLVDRLSDRLEQANA